MTIQISPTCQKSRVPRTQFYSSHEIDVALCYYETNKSRSNIEEANWIPEWNSGNRSDVIIRKTTWYPFRAHFSRTEVRSSNPELITLRNWDISGEKIGTYHTCENWRKHENQEELTKPM
jgi:hypothetical protein